jgi:formylglycine-generating enzyme required for sulfatase activity
VNLPAAVEVGPFFMDKAEVTNARYLEFCASAQWRAPANAAAQPSDYPVTGVTFYDAQAYAAWLNKKLPTEAQWARAAADSTGAVMKYPWGSVFEDGAANFTGAPDTVLKYERDLTSDGIVGLAGNASEWTRTLFRPLPYTTADGRDDPAAPDFGKGMVVRGGNYGDTVHSPMDQRQEVPFEAAYETLGFRCVVTPPATLAGMEKLAGM